MSFNSREGLCIQEFQEMNNFVVVQRATSSTCAAQHSCKTPKKLKLQAPKRILVLSGVARTALVAILVANFAFSPQILKLNHHQLGCRPPCLMLSYVRHSFEETSHSGSAEKYRSARLSLCLYIEQRYHTGNSLTTVFCTEYGKSVRHMSIFRSSIITAPSLMLSLCGGCGSW